MKWLPHLILLGIAGTMVAVAWARHVTTAEAIEVAFDRSASTDERLWGMHVAACRASRVNGQLGAELAQAFLASGDERLAEAAVLIDLCRHAQRAPNAPDAAPKLQEAYARAPLPESGWTPHRIRTMLLHRRKVGGKRYGGVRRMNRDEAELFIDTLTGGPIPASSDVHRLFFERGLVPATMPSPRSPR